MSILAQSWSDNLPWRAARLQIPAFSGQIHALEGRDCSEFQIVLELISHRSAMTITAQRAMKRRFISIGIRADGSFDVPKISAWSGRATSWWTVTAYLLKTPAGESPVELEGWHSANDLSPFEESYLISGPTTDEIPAVGGEEAERILTRESFSAGVQFQGPNDFDFVRTRLIPALKDIYVRDIPSLLIPYEVHLTGSGEEGLESLRPVGEVLPQPNPPTRPYIAFSLTNSAHLWLFFKDLRPPRSTNLKWELLEGSLKPIETEPTTIAVFGEDGSGLQEFRIVASVDTSAVQKLHI